MARGMRVLAIATLFPDSTRPGFGGFVERSMIRLAAVPGIALTVIAPCGVPPWPLGLHPRYRARRALPLSEVWKGVDVRRPRFALLPGVGWRANAALIARAALPYARGADVIHAEFFFPDGVAATRLGARLGVPVSIKARGSDIHLWGAKPPVRRAMLGAAGQACGMLAVSESLRGDMIAMGMSAEKIAVHYTGVDLNTFAPVDRVATRAAMGLPAPLVVSVGNLIALKGHDVVIRAVASLPGVHLRIVGHGPERDTLEGLISALRAGDRIALTGPLPHAEVARLLAAADVMALASEREGLANAWVEAIACGTPVVATDVGGAAEVIDRPAAGRLAARNPGAFAAAIGALLAAAPDPEATRAGGERFDWGRHTAQLVAHLKRCAGAR
jgi:teichuronic acid biosynthesis glycosyltransferase TuaC